MEAKTKKYCIIVRLISGKDYRLTHNSIDYVNQFIDNIMHNNVSSFVTSSDETVVVFLDKIESISYYKI